MGRHRARSYRASKAVVGLALATVAVIAAYVIVVVAWRSDDAAVSTPVPAPCSTMLRVVTASSFAPVLTALTPALDRGDDCVRLHVTVADGRTAAARVVELGAHVWIPDDAAWAGVAPANTFVPADSRVAVATSPIYLVTDPATAKLVSAAGGSWLGLAGLATSGTGVRLAVRDPAGSGDGLVAAGAVGEAVWLDAGMNASAQALSAALAHTRTVQHPVALPKSDGEVGLIPEHALPPAPSSQNRELVVLAATDHTAQLRFTWVPTAEASRDPALSRAMARTLQAIRGPQADERFKSPPQSQEISGRRVIQVCPVVVQRWREC